MKETCDGIVALNASAKVDVKSLQHWEPGRITALFDGLAKVQVAVSGKIADEVIRYRIDTMDPKATNPAWSECYWLNAGTTQEDAQKAFNRAADDMDIRVRLVECREQPLAIASAKVGA